jgi:putative protease
MELVAPAGSFPALKAAVDQGADAVYIGFRNGANARNFPGLNFSPQEAEAAIRYAHDRRVKVFCAINTHPDASQWRTATDTVDHAARLGIDALILADIGLLGYAADRYPDVRRHLSVQASATNWRAIAFYQRHFGIQRAVLPRVLSAAQVRTVIQKAPVEIEVFGFGSLCVMVEGRCALSSYVTGASPNTRGVCSPAEKVRWIETPAGREARLNGVLIDLFAPGERAGYPTLCKGRFRALGTESHVFEEPTSLNVIGALPELLAAGVKAIKIEGRQRSPAYVAQVVRAMREALDRCHAGPAGYQPPEQARVALESVAEGRCHTLGALDRAWQ